MKKVCLIFLVASLAIGCSKEDDLSTGIPICPIPGNFAPIGSKINITQGVYGVISFTEGNCMPGSASSTCKTYPVCRTVKIYQYTTTNQATRANNMAGFFYERFTTQLVAETKSDANGFFQLTLPAGNYTMVVVENELLYAAYGDGQGGINPITIGTGTTEANFPIQYKAAF